MFTVVKVGAVVFAAYFLFTDPLGAAHFMQHLFAALRTAGASLSHFASNV